jgi:hypothetical protein
MTNDHRTIARLLRKAADRVEGYPESVAVHTVTITLHGHSESGVRATIEADDLHEDFIESREPVIFDT